MSARLPNQSTGVAASALFAGITGPTRFALAAIPLLVPLRADHLSPLAPKPDWDSLEPYQKTITRGEFTRLVNNVYSVDGAFWAYCNINDERVVIYSDLATLHKDFLSSKGTTSILCGRTADRVIIDEVDSLLLDRAENVTYLGHTIPDIRYMNSLYIQIYLAVQRVLKKDE